MKYQKELLVTKKTVLNPMCFLLHLKSEEPLCNIQAGQFVNILVKDIADRILRRPISIHDVDYTNNEIIVVVQKIGKATTKLSLINEGDKLDVVFPLGNSFPLIGEKPLLIGGGVGTAPLYYLSKKFNENNIRPTILIGAKTKDQLFLIDKYSAVADVYISTEDGSVGEKGMVTTNSILNQQFTSYLTCGPAPMMKAIAIEAQKRGVDCYVSMENRMACGIGACLCCVTATTKGNECVCTAGPVFNANDIKW